MVSGTLAAFVGAVAACVTLLAWACDPSHPKSFTINSTTLPRAGAACHSSAAPYPWKG
jgi:hypothetical protein